MKKILPLLLLILSLNVSAVDIKDVINGICEPISPTVTQCSETFDEALYHQCAVSLCGSPETASLAAVNDKNFEKYVNAEIKKRFPDIDEPAKKMFEQKKKSMESLVEALEKKLDGKEGLNIDSWDESEFSHLSRVVYDDIANTSIDLEKPISERLEVIIDLPEDASETLKKGAEEFAAMKKERLLTIPYEGMYEDLYTKEESLAMLKEFAKKFYDEYNTIAAQTPDVLPQSKAEIEKYKNIDALKLEDNIGIGSAYVQLIYLYNSLLYVSGKPVQVENTTKKCGENCKNGIKEYVSKLDLKNKLQGFKKKLDKATADDTVISCQAELIQRSLKEGNRNEFLKTFPAVKKNFMTKVTASYSEHSKKAWSKYLDNEIHLSFSAEESDGVDEFIEEVKEESKSSPQDYSTSSSSSLLQAFMNHQDENSEHSPDMGKCHTERAFAAWDAFSPKDEMSEDDFYGDMDPKKDNISVSLFSCTHASEGRGVISHEMGHALSYAFMNGKLSKHSENGYNKIRTCATNLYKSPIKSEDGLLSRETDSLRTEEDMADVIGFLATREDKKLFSCALLDTNKAGTKYEDLALVNSLAIDPHSSVMLRVLMEALYKKKPLHPSCQSIINNNSDKFRFKPCI